MLVGELMRDLECTTMLVKCLSSMSELVYVLYGLSEAEVPSLLLLSTNMHMSCPLPLAKCTAV